MNLPEYLALIKEAYKETEEQVKALPSELRNRLFNSHSGLENSIFAQNSQQFSNIKYHNPLQVKCGLSDNWSIYLKGDLEIILKDILATKSFKIAKPDTNRLMDNLKRYRAVLNYKPGTMVLSLKEGEPHIISLHAEESSEESYTLIQRIQRNNYNVILMAHPYQKKKMPENFFEMSMAKMILEIGEVILSKSIPACFKKTKNLNQAVQTWNFEKDGPYDRVIFHP